MRRAVVLSLPLAASLFVAVSPVVLVAAGLGALALGAFAGRVALAGFALAYAALSVGYQLLLWEDDPALTGIDDIPPVAGIVLVLPFALVPIGLGALATARLRRR